MAWLLFFAVAFVPRTGNASESEARRAVAQLALHWAADDPGLEELFLDPTSVDRDALAEILGPPGLPCRWTLRVESDDSAHLDVLWPSGLGDVVRLELTGTPDGTRIVRLESLSRISGPEAGGKPASTAGLVASVDATPGASVTPGVPLPRILLAVGGGLFVLALAVPSRRGILATLAVLSAGAGLLLPRLGEDPSGPEAPRPPPVSSSARAPSFPLDLALDPPSEDPAQARASEGSREASRRALGAAIRALANDAAAETIGGLLAEIPDDHDAPILPLVRALYEIRAGDETRAALALEAFEDRSGPAEGLQAVVASLWGGLGFPEREEEARERAVEADPADEDFWYSMVAHELTESTQTRAEEALERAWTLRPRPRADLLSDPALSWLLGASPTARELVGFAAPGEPVVPCPSPPAPVRLGGSVAEAATVGSALLLRVGEAVVVVQEGCALAPPGTVARSADEIERLLIDWWLPRAEGAGSLRGPLLGELAEGLVREARWDDVLRLVPPTTVTDPIPRRATQLRARALQETGRLEEAIPLLVEVAQGLVRAGAPDPSLHYQLAEQLRRADQRDAALRLLELADRRWPRLGFDRRLLQVRIEDHLLRRALQLEVGRFLLSFPPEQDPWIVQRIGRLLEAESARLRRWIPEGSGRPIRVLLLSSDDFREAYGAGGVLGLWDGMIRVPYGDVVRLEPEMVTVLTHELAHALIADLTADRAPAWLHEGLAQHVQLLQPRSNPIIDPHRLFDPLPFPLLDPILSGPPHPEMTTMAYEEALWAIHFVEDRYGIDGIRRLLAAAAEPDADRVLRSALGLGAVEFHGEFLAWAHEDAPRIWPLDRETMAEYLPPPPPRRASEADMEAAALEGLARLLAALFGEG